MQRYLRPNVKHTNTPLDFLSHHDFSPRLFNTNHDFHYDLMLSILSILIARSALSIRSEGEDVLCTDSFFLLDYKSDAYLHTSEACADEVMPSLHDSYVSMVFEVNWMVRSRMGWIPKLA